MASKVLIGNRVINLEDVIKVAVHKATVTLDTVTIEALKKERKGKDAVQESDLPSDPPVSQSSLSEEVVRAIIFTRLVSFLGGKAELKLEFITFVVQILNAGITPLVADTSEDTVILDSLVSSFLGKGSCRYNGETLGMTEALSAAGLNIPPCTKQDLRALGRANATGAASAMLALAVYMGHNCLTNVADAVCALSCEALHASSKPFSSDFYDVCRPHRGAMVSAGNVRMALEGSKSVDGKGGEEGVNLSVVYNAPQYHGPAREAFSAANTMLNIEINSAEGDASHRFSAQPLVLTALTIENCMRVISAASQSRVVAMSQSPLAPKDPAPALLPRAHEILASAAAQPSPISQSDVVVLDRETATHASAGVARAAAALTAVNTALRCLAAEAAVALESLYLQDVARGVVPKDPAADANGPPPPAEDSEQGAKKDKKKEKKQGKSGALVLGKGTTALRALLSAGVDFSKDGASGSAIEAVLKNMPVFSREFIDAIASLFVVASGRRVPKIAKGTRDIAPEAMAVREKAFKIITDVFKRHGAVAIDTPVFELKETLTGKYGEDSKLIYDLADQGGEILALRYDLTVPFARYVAMNGISSIKRYHIAKVYRRDNPAMKSGRFREFYQCDLDIAGQYGTMIPDSEILVVLTEILDGLKIGSYVVKLNHRKLLDAVLEICGCPAVKFRSICSAIDKLDKESWEDVRSEMVDQKGLAAEAADRIGELVRLNGRPTELLERLRSEGRFKGHAGGESALAELATLFSYLDAFGVSNKILFDLSLARGLDYYTGVIYEAVLTETNRVGTIAAGGRYDELVGMFNPSSKQIPAVGVSIGIERISTIMEDLAKNVRKTETEVLVASVGKGMLEERMRICAELWKHSIKAEFMYTAEPKIGKQIEFALEEGIPHVVIVGEDEVKQGVVKVKTLATKSEAVVQRNQLPNHLLQLIADTVSAPSPPAESQ